MEHSPHAAVVESPHTKPPTSSRRAGLVTIGEGLFFAAVGILGLWISFRLADGAKTILGAGPLVGGGMIGHGATQMLFGERLRPIRWVAAVLGGVITLGATIVLLELTLGVTFA